MARMDEVVVATRRTPGEPSPAAVPVPPFELFFEEHHLRLFRALYRTSIQLLTYSGTIEPEDRVRASLGHAMDALARGVLRVPIDEVLPLAEANEAHRRIREREVRGKLLLQP